MKKGNKIFLKDFAIGIAIILGLSLLGFLYWDEFVNIMIRFPIFEQLYLIGVSEIERKSIIGLSIITFSGALFFIGYPAEVLYIAYVRAGYSMIYVAFVMTIFTMLSQVINYGFGYFIEKKVLKEYVKHREKEFMRNLKKYDMIFILIINTLPLPADILSVLLGMIKYPFKKAMLYSLAGKLLKFFFIAILLLMIQGVFRF